MTRNGNGLGPVLDIRNDTVYEDGCAEYRTVKNGTDGSVGALPHFLQVILLHTGAVGGDGCALDCNAVLEGCICGIYGYTVVGCISVLQTEIVILCLQIHKRKNQLILDHLPEDSGHLISVHLYKRGCHFNFVHSFFPFHRLHVSRFLPYFRKRLSCADVQASPRAHRHAP